MGTKKTTSVRTFSRSARKALFATPSSTRPGVCAPPLSLFVTLHEHAFILLFLIES